MKTITKTAVLILSLAASLSCSQEEKMTEPLDGHYIVVETREETVGEETVETTSTGEFDIVTNQATHTAEISGYWDTYATIEEDGTVLRLGDVRVKLEDGTDVIYSFGPVRSSESNYRLKGSFTAEGVLPDKWGDPQYRYFSGTIDARKTKR